MAIAADTRRIKYARIYRTLIDVAMQKPAPRRQSRNVRASFDAEEMTARALCTTNTAKLWILCDVAAIPRIKRRDITPIFPRARLLMYY